ncbi:hypothetical protein BE11_50085 [Sorangium cellulosum]|nr:hypothetical protein BE11_50085 [Sorangium cellulosum]
MARHTLFSFGFVAAALVVAACSDDNGGNNGATSGPGSTSSASGGGGAGGGGAGGGGGGGGAPDDKDPAEVTSADDCFYDGAGGANAFRCSAATIQLAEPVPVAALTFVVETSEGDVFDAASQDLPLGVRVEVDQGGGAGGGGGDGGGSGAVATALVVYVDSPPPQYDPTWIDVQVRVDGEIVGSKRFEDLEFACVARSSDDWCWESEPVTLPIDAMD